MSSSGVLRKGDKGDKGDPGGFTAATDLAANDLNTIFTSGLYRQGNAANATLALNYPVTSLGSLEVTQGATANDLMQKYLPHSNGPGAASTIFIRRYTAYNTTWTPWNCLTKTRIDQTAGRAIYSYDYVNNREQLVYGDTGWRDITPAYADNGFTSGTFEIRRFNNIVSFRMKSVILSAGSGIVHQVWGLTPTTFPSGFRQLAAERNFFQVSDNSLTVVQNFSLYASAYLAWVGSWSAAGNSTTRPTTALSGSMSYTTDDPWPTTLPGTASGSIPNA